MHQILSLIFVVLFLGLVTSQVIDANEPYVNINMQFANTFSFPETCELPPMTPLARPPPNILIAIPDLLEQMVAQGYTTFAKMITAAGLATYVKTTPTLTIFVPTEGAISSWGQKNLNNYLNPANFSNLVELVMYHFVNASVPSSVLSTLTYLETAEGENVSISSNSLGQPTINGNNIRQADITAVNGIMQAVTGVLIPPSQRTLGLLPLLVANGFTSFTNAIFAVAANLSFTYPNIITVFAPNEVAWANLDPKFQAQLATNQNLLLKTVLNHVIVGLWPKSTFYNTESWVTLAGTTLTLGIRNLEWRVNDVLITRFDQYGFNGLYHEIDMVLNPIPSDPIPQVAQSVGLDIFVSYLNSTGLSTVLSGTGPFTAFIPTDATLLANNITNTPYFALALSYYVVGGEILFPANGTISPSTYSSQLFDGLTGQAEQLTFTRGANNSIVINGVATIVSPPISATNGIIYAINGVLPAASLQVLGMIPTLIRQGLTTTLQAWNVSGLLSVLNGTSLTLFAPTNAAWQGMLPLGMTEAQLFAPANNAILQSILLFQLSGMQLNTSYLRTGVLPSIPTLLGSQSISLTLLVNGLLVNGATIVTPDTQTTNGYIQAINTVIYPTSILPKTLWALISSDPTLSQFAQYLQVTNLYQLLQSPTNYTVFAPTNAVFAKAGFDPNYLVQIIQYHIVPGVYYSTSLRPPVTALSTLEGSNLNVTDIITNTSQTIEINNAVIVRSDISATNGVLQVINGVLYPTGIFPPTIIDVILDEGATTFYDLIGLAGLTSLLASPGPYTVLAPSNLAFQAMDQTLLAGLRADPFGSLRNLLLYHIISSGVYDTNDFPTGPLSTLFTDNITVANPQTGVQFTSTSGNSAVVTIANEISQNGITHIINAVLIPQSLVAQNLYQLLQTQSRISTFVSLLSTYGITNDIFGDVTEPLTVWAPTNAAITTSQSQYPAYWANTTTATLILQYHFAVGRYVFQTLTQGLQITTISRGEIISVQVTNNVTKTLNNIANILQWDLIANSEYNPGVLDIIDTVLVPPFISLPSP